MNGLVQKQRLNEDDLVEIRQLERLGNRYDGIEVKLNWEMMQQRRPAEIGDFCFYQAGQLIGYAPLDSFGGMFELTAIVHPDYRRRGIFNQLFAAAKQETLRRQARQLLLVSYKASSSGAAVARKFGLYQSSEYRMQAEAANLPPLPPGQLQLVEVEPAHLPELSRLLGLVFSSSRWNSVEELSRSLNSAHEHFWLAKLKEQYIGQIGVTNEEKTAYIRAVGIVPDYRGQGYGRQLLAATVQKLLDQGFRHFELDVATQNESALSLYQSCGFHETNVYDYYEVAL